MISQLMIDLSQAGIRLKVYRGRLKYFPPKPMPQDLADRVKAHKPELLAALAMDDERQQAHAAMLERINAAYQGGSIDWPPLDEIDERIWSAETVAELMKAVEDYESMALSGNSAGLCDLQWVLCETWRNNEQRN